MTPSDSRQMNPGPKEEPSHEGGTESEARYDNRAGLTGMIKSFSDMPKYGSSFQYDLDETIEAFETVAELCDVTSDQQLKKAIPTMLKGSAFRLYSLNKEAVTGYKEEKRCFGVGMIQRRSRNGCLRNGTP